MKVSRIKNGFSVRSTCIILAAAGATVVAASAMVPNEAPVTITHADVDADLENGQMYKVRCFDANDVLVEDMRESHYCRGQMVPMRAANN